MKMPPSGYMVYVLIDPRDMVPFYVGMTCRPGQRWNGLNWDGAAHDRLAELRKLRLKCRVRIAAIGLSLEEARDRERQTISLHRATIANWRPRSQPKQAAA